jgi:hypothetical protein
MALPTSTDLKKMDYAFQGQPFVDVPGKDSIDLATMDYAFQGQPFVRNPAESAAPTTSSNFFNFFNIAT